MTDKLKTLKDIDGKIKGHFGLDGKNLVIGGNLDNPEPTYVNEDVLRDGAIKEIKLIYECEGKYPFGTLHEHLEFLDEDYSLYDSEEYIKGIINYIKWKNNITEEELK